MRGRRTRAALSIVFRGLLLLSIWSVAYVIIHQTTWTLPPEIKVINRELLNQTTNREPLSFRLHTSPPKNLTDAQLVTEWSRHVLSLPSRYLRKPTGYKVTKCARYPNFHDLRIENDLWQQFQSSRGNGAIFHIFGAYLDDRPHTHVVRVLLMVDRVNPPNVTCQLWYDDGKGNPRIIVANVGPTYTYIWNSKWGNYKDGGLQPYLLTCPIPTKINIPESVSLVDKPCDNATNNVKVFSYPKKVKNDKFNNINKTLKFAVCVKGLNFYHEDVAVRLVEWLELLRAFGVDKVFTYDLAVHPNVSKLLDYYAEKGFIQRYALSLPGTQLTNPALIDFYLRNKKVVKRQHEVVPYNDCFYRHRHEYDYIALLDIDELIVPLQNTTWHALLTELRGKTVYDSYYASNAYFFDDTTHKHGWDNDIPIYMHMLQHVWRAQNHTKQGTYVKSFFNTDTVLALHNHMPFFCMSRKQKQRSCKVSSIKTNMAQLQHYRKDCDTSIRNSCQNLYHKYLIVDDNLKRFSNPVVNNTVRVLQDLGILEYF